ncbi:MAG: hypothetical protein AAGU75_19385, partial [Bacillota bacterium]
ITTSNDEMGEAEELAAQLEKEIQAYLDSKEGIAAEVEAEAVGLERVQEARELGVTPGKLNLVEKLQSATDGAIDVKEWLSKPVKEINKAIKENRSENKIKDQSEENDQREQKDSNNQESDNIEKPKKDRSDIPANGNNLKPENQNPQKETERIKNENNNQRNEQKGQEQEQEQVENENRGGNGNPPDKSNGENQNEDLKKNENKTSGGSDNKKYD